MTMTKTITTDKKGYAVYVRCGLQHSGNTGFVRTNHKYWACQGCGNNASNSEVATTQRGEETVQGTRLTTGSES